LQTKQFVRDATGLVREYGAMDTLLFASVFVFALVFTITQFAWFYGNTLGAPLAPTLLLAAVPFAFLMISYWAIGVLMPRTGNDYVFVGRILHPSIGFAWGLFYVLIVFLAAFIGAGVGPLSLAASSIFSVAGLMGNSATLVNLGNFVSGGYGALEFMVLLTVIVAAFTVFGARLIKAFLYITWIFAIVGMIVMWYILSTTSNATFISNWNQLLSGGNANYTYAGLQNFAGTSAPFSYAVGLGGVVAALPLGFLFLFGGNYANAFAGEIKNVKKSLPIALFLSLILGLGYWILTSTLTVNVVGFNWITTVGHAWNTCSCTSTPSTGYPLPYNPTQPLILAVAAYQNPLLVNLMFITYIIGSLGPVFAYFWIPTKYLFAWSFDRVIPSKFADVSSRFHSAWVAVIATVVIAFIAEVLYNILGYSSYFSMGTVLWGISYTIPGLALTIFPYVKKDLFAGAPGWMGKKVAGIPLLSIVGFITTLGFGIVGYIAFSSTVVNFLPVSVTAGVVAITIFGGLAIYFLSKWYHKREGIDISMALKEIPPE
jgi:amino acid transporter